MVALVAGPYTCDKVWYSTKSSKKKTRRGGGRLHHLMIRIQFIRHRLTGRRLLYVREVRLVGGSGRAQQHQKTLNGFRIHFTIGADIALPGGRIGDSDKVSRMPIGIRDGPSL